MYNIIVSSRGQIVIPAEARKKLGIKEGDVLFAHLEEDGRLVLKAGQKRQIKKGIVDQTAGILSDMEVSGTEYVDGIRKDSGRRLDELEGGI